MLCRLFLGLKYFFEVKILTESSKAPPLLGCSCLCGQQQRAYCKELLALINNFMYFMQDIIFLGPMVKLGSYVHGMDKSPVRLWLGPPLKFGTQNTVNSIQFSIWIPNL